MEIEIVRVRKSAVLDHILFVDVVIKNPGITIKGICFNLKSNAFHFPTHKTEGGKPYTQIMFQEQAFKEFKEKFLDLIQDQIIPKEKEEVTDEQRKKIMDQHRDQHPKKDVRRGFSGSQTPHGARKPERS